MHFIRNAGMEKLTAPRKNCAISRAESRVAAGRVKILLSLPADKKVRNQLVRFDKELLEKYPGIYHANRNKAVKALRMSRYRLYGAAVWALSKMNRSF